MRRALAVAAALIALLAVAVTAEVRLSSIQRADPLGKRLLYLPTAEMLGLGSLGNRGLAADLVYLWSIQYYSQFQPHEQFLYLEKVFDLITDLDPLYFDAYRIGAMIMTIDTSASAAERRAAVRRLYDKGLRNMPSSWELAEVAAWDALQQLRDPELAIHYAKIGAAIPGAPPRLLRVYGRWEEKAGQWTPEDSLAYWQDVLAEAVRKPDVILAKSRLYDAVARLDGRRLDPLLAAYRDRFGHCPDSWRQLVELGWLERVPTDYVGNPYRIDREHCRLEPHKRIRWN